LEVLDPVLYSDFSDILKEVSPFTMTSAERMYALYKSVQYLVKANIEGDFVECGVWKGGSMMLAAMELQRLTSVRDLYLFDTFTGMSEPGAFDTHRGVSAREQWENNREGELNWGHISMDQVKRNMYSTGYPIERMKFVQGRVEETLRISENVPEKISILRLDTDWYESTKVELETLFPRLMPGGVLILDDFGWWEGSRKAVEEYFSKYPRSVLFHRIDQSCRVAVKSYADE
jgi:hypothetical protein